MCVCVCLYVLALMLFSVISGNIPQMTVTQIEVVGEGNCGTAESFFPEHCVLRNMNHSQNSTKISLMKKEKVPSSFTAEATAHSPLLQRISVFPHLPRLQMTPPVCV